MTIGGWGIFALIAVFIIGIGAPIGMGMTDKPFGIAIGGLYLWVGYRMGPANYLLAWSGLFAAGALGMLRWLDTRGSRAFMALD